MKKVDYELFRIKSELILEGMREKGINFEVVDGPEENSPSYYIKLTDPTLRRWKLGIWAIGKWSDFYDIESESEVVVFLIHDWSFDKWRPSSSDLSWSFLPDSTYFGNFLFDLNEIKNHPIKGYGEVFYYPTYPRKEWTLLYLKEWYYNVISTPFKYKLKNVWSPWVLFITLWIITLFDKRVKKIKIFKEKLGGYNNYTFSFLATLLCSEDDESFYKFYRLYSYWPSKLKKKSKFNLFDATYNVSDYEYGMNDDQIRTRMFRGVWVEKPEKK